MDAPCASFLQVLDNEQLALAFRYFDRTGAGYLRTDDLRKLVDLLGLGRNHAAVKQLALCVAVSAGPRSHACPFVLNFFRVFFS